MGQLKRRLEGEREILNTGWSIGWHDRNTKSFECCKKMSLKSKCNYRRGPPRDIEYAIPLDEK